MISSILGFDYTFDFEYFLIMVLTVALSLYLKFLLTIFTDYLSVESPEKLFSFLFLPLAGLIITSVISNNIALSLGMVGALSIVRFRTPVKNPSELVLYFILITLGIVINVNPSLAINFVLFISLLLLLVDVYKKFASKLFGKESKKYSDKNYFLQVNLKSENIDLYKHKSLKHFSKSEDGYCLYIFESDNIGELNTIKDGISKEDLINISIDF
tara:strand:+ start:1672 stop:2313 length:642 start_codon:yes stop_codon:yes gene_type:complete